MDPSVLRHRLIATATATGMKGEGSMNELCSANCTAIISNKLLLLNLSSSKLKLDIHLGDRSVHNSLYLQALASSSPPSSFRFHQVY